MRGGSVESMSVSGCGMGGRQRVLRRWAWPGLAVACSRPTRHPALPPPANPPSRLSRYCSATPAVGWRAGGGAWRIRVERRRQRRDVRCVFLVEALFYGQGSCVLLELPGSKGHDTPRVTHKHVHPNPPPALRSAVRSLSACPGAAALVARGADGHPAAAVAAAVGCQLSWESAAAGASHSRDSLRHRS